MCLISFNWKDHPVYQLVLVGNRDEYYTRPTASLHLWESGFYAGKDLKGGGTWMGFHPKGKFAALTNYRDFSHSTFKPVTRGYLVKDFLENNQEPVEYLKSIQKRMGQYEGFNLLVADGDRMAYLSNRRQEIEIVSPGIHGISNALLDTPWPKVELAKKELRHWMESDLLDENVLLNLLQSEEYASDIYLPSTGVSYDMERLLSAQFIKMGEEYGTVNTSVILWKHDGQVIIKERRTVPSQETTVKFQIDS